jgi:hypothetical protein
VKVDWGKWEEMGEPGAAEEGMGVREESDILVLLALND